MGIIGGADGPTVIFIENPIPLIIGAVAVIAAVAAIIAVIIKNVNDKKMRRLSL